MLTLIDDGFIEHLKALAPATADLELRSLSPGDGDDLNELLHFIRALTSVLRQDGIMSLLKHG